MSKSSPHNSAVKTFLSFLSGKELLLELPWEDYMKVDAPYHETKYSTQEVTARYSRNGYDWDIHGTLYIPEREILQDKAILMVHGGGVNELTFDRAPGGRPGLARIAASLGFKVLSVSYPGQWAPGGVWLKPADEREPIFLFDRETDAQELQDRLLKYTLNLVVQGIATLTDQHLAGKNVIAFGHSIGGRIIVDLYRFVKNVRIVGLIGYGGWGPGVWERELQEKLGRSIQPDLYRDRAPTLEELTRFRRLMQSANEARMYLPVLRSIPELEACARATGLPREEYFDNIIAREPDSKWLSRIRVLLMVGENDNVRHWPKDQPLEERPEYFYAEKFAEVTHGAHLVVVPKYTHYGQLEAYSEKVVYLWLWAVKSGYFR